MAERKHARFQRRGSEFSSVESQRWLEIIFSSRSTADRIRDFRLKATFKFAISNALLLESPLFQFVHLILFKKNFDFESNLWGVCVIYRGRRGWNQRNCPMIEYKIANRCFNLFITNSYIHFMSISKGRQSLKWSYVFSRAQARLHVRITNILK